MMRSMHIQWTLATQASLELNSSTYFPFLFWLDYAGSLINRRNEVKQPEIGEIFDQGRSYCMLLSCHAWSRD